MHTLEQDVSMATVNDEIQQKAEWRARAISDIVLKAHDDETLVEMLEACLNQAHSEGLGDAAYICDKVADDPGIEPVKRRTAKVLARSIRDLDKLNKQIPRS
jgi:hypothetical protein